VAIEIVQNVERFRFLSWRVANAEQELLSA
jgi:hypothetical protein